MFRTGISFKVSVVYVLLGAVICFALWLVYGNMRSLMLIGDAERRMTERRGAADSLVYSIMDVNNSSQSAVLGLSDDLADFDRNIARTLHIAARLKGMAGDSVQKARIDSLEILLAEKRENTLMIMAAVAESNNDVYYKAKVRDLRRGRDSVVIHPKTAETAERHETVYEVVRTRKSFFGRLSDAFRRQRNDTVSTTLSSGRAVVDSVKHNIDIADTVAGVLARIKSEDDRLKSMSREKLMARERSQQIVGVQIADRIETLLEDIRKAEQASLHRAMTADVVARRGIMVKLLSLAAVALSLAGLLSFLVWRDTRRARIYRETLERANAENERLLEQRERLLLTITHDIKAPAASISGFAELLGGRVADEKTASCLESMRSSASHLLRLVSELLDYHRLEKGKMEVQPVSFSVPKLVVSCVEEMRPQASAKGLYLTCDITGCGTGLCRGDAFRIRQVLENLLSNAIKYTSEGGVEVKAAVNGTWLRFSVKDTGQGMSPEETRRVFGAFTRLPGAQGIEGVGLGLSITRELVNLLGGRVVLSSAKGKGSTFTVSVPLETAAGEAAEQEETAVLPPANHKIVSAERRRIMVIDDDGLQLKLLGEMLGRLTEGRWQVTTCQHVDDGLRLLQGGGYAVLITDIEMPEMNGREMIRRIDRSATAVIGMTAHERDIEPQLRKDGFDACLFKPFTISGLADVLTAVTGCKFIVSEDKEKEPETPSRFAALTAFAGGDKEAEREIMQSFKADLQRSAASLRAAIAAGDRSAIAATAHKALPTMSMVNAVSAETLKRLTPDGMKDMTDEDLEQAVTEVVRDMDGIEGEIDYSS